MIKIIMMSMNDGGGGGGCGVIFMVVTHLPIPPHLYSPQLNFGYWCHRANADGSLVSTNHNSQPKNSYAVNSISFHPGGKFATAGADGTIYFWDKDERKRTTTFQKMYVYYYYYYYYNYYYLKTRMKGGGGKEGEKVVV